MEQAPVSAVGMVWYTLEHYAEIKAMMKDGHRLPATYTQWRLKAEAAEKQMRRQGHLVFRAHLEPDAFRQYVSTHGLDFDADGRTHFASFIAKQEASKMQRH